MDPSYLDPRNAVTDILQGIAQGDDDFYMETFDIYTKGQGLITELVDNDEVAMIRINSTTYDKETNEPIPALQQPTFFYAVDRNTWEFNPNYGDKARTGLFLPKIYPIIMR